MKYKGYTIKIEQDDDPLNPVEDWDMLGTMVFWHRRMNLGHVYQETSRLDPSEWLVKWLEGNREDLSPEVLEVKSMDELMLDFQKTNLLIPVFAYEHGSITIRAGSKHPYWDSWDSGQLGFTYVPHEKIIAEYGDLSANSIEKATQCLRAEIESYDDYLNNNVYGYIVEDEGGEHLDSSWGFFGDEGKKEAESDAKSFIDHHAKEQYNKGMDNLPELAGE